MQHHKPILYTREATCDSYFNISNNLDICISFFMSGKLQSSYKLGYCSASPESSERAQRHTFCFPSDHGIPLCIVVINNLNQKVRGLGGGLKSMHSDLEEGLIDRTVVVS